MKDKKHCKAGDLWHYTLECRGAANNICKLKYSVPKKFPIAFHNGSNNDYNFIIKKLQCTCLEENTEKYITFTVSLEKEVTRIDENGEKPAENLSYILQFIDRARFIASSLSVSCQ